jgi:hypothetical protein
LRHAAAMNFSLAYLRPALLVILAVAVLVLMRM